MLHDNLEVSKNSAHCNGGLDRYQACLLSFLIHKRLCIVCQDIIKPRLTFKTFHILQLEINWLEKWVKVRGFIVADTVSYRRAALLESHSGGFIQGLRYLSLSRA